MQMMKLLLCKHIAEPQELLVCLALLSCSPLCLLSQEAKSIGQKVQNTGQIKPQHTFSSETFGSDSRTPLVILLHGASGPSEFYREQAKLLVKHGYQVIMPHYLEGTKNAAGSEENYKKWVEEVERLLTVQKEADKGRRIALVGFSLGASIALAVGSRGHGPDAIAEWYGSLPDRYFHELRGMPPLLILQGEQDSNVPVINALQLKRLCQLLTLTCDAHIFPNQEHGFDRQTLVEADRYLSQLFRKMAGYRKRNSNTEHGHE